MRDWRVARRGHRGHMLIPWEDESIARAQSFLKSTQREMSTDDPDQLLEIIEHELNDTIVAWAEGDPVAAGWMDAYFVVRGMLRFHRTAIFLRDMSGAASDARREAVKVMIEAARSAGRVHQDWSYAEKEVTAAYWSQAEDHW